MNAQDIKLPVCHHEDGTGFMKAVKLRHSTRSFNTERIPDMHVMGQLLWATAGVNRQAETPEKGNPIDRCNPTALNSQEISVYLFGKDAVYEYMPRTHSLRFVYAGDHRNLLAGTSGFRQDFVMDAPYTVLFVADYGKLPGGEEARLMAAVDAGIACENLNLACAAMGLATVPRATMDKAALSGLLGLSATQLPLMNNPVGYPAE